MAIIQRTYQYKVYRQGVYLGLLPNVTSDFSYVWDVNTSGTDIIIKVSQTADTADQKPSYILAENGDYITDESGNRLIMERQPDLVGSANPSALISNGNQVKVYEFSNTHPTGVLVFSGVINRWEAGFSGSNNTDEITVFVYSNGQDLDNYIYGTNAYTLQTSQPIITNGGDYAGLTNYGDTTTSNAVAQSLVESGYNLSLIRIIACCGNGFSGSVPTATITLKLYQGVDPRSGGTLLSTALTTITNQTQGSVDFILPSTIALSGNYYFTLESSAPVSVFGSFTSSHPYATGQSLYYFPPTWLQSGTDDFAFYLYSSTAIVTNASFTSYDPAQMIRDAIGAYLSQGGLISYSGLSIVNTSLSITYSFVLATIYEIIKKALDLSPSTYYFYSDVATDILTFKPRTSTATYKFTKGKHIESLRLIASIENLKNSMYFSGGNIGAGINLYKKYSDSTSVNSYGAKLSRQSDNRVIDTGAADSLGQSFISSNKDEQYQTQVTIMDEQGVDITLIKPGDMVGFAGFGTFIDTLVLQVVRIVRKPEYVQLTLGSTPPQIALSLEETVRSLNALQTIANPSSPS